MKDKTWREYPLSKITYISIVYATIEHKNGSDVMSIIASYILTQPSGCGGNAKGPTPQILVGPVDLMNKLQSIDVGSNLQCRPQSEPLIYPFS